MNNKSKENELPFYWAAPILVGKTDLISLNDQLNWNIWILIIGLMIVSGVVGFRIFYQKKRAIQ